MKNKVVIVSVILIILIVASIIGVRIYNRYKIHNGLEVKDGIKPPLKIDILKDNIKSGEAIGVISSWKYNGSIATSSLVTAKTILEKEDSLENVKAGDLVKLSTNGFDLSLIESIYEVTYNAMDSEENIILPIDEMIDFSLKTIEVPILRENLNKTLYYHVTIKIQDKGTVVYFFKVEP